MSTTKSHEEFVELFAQGVGKQKAESILEDAIEQAGIGVQDTYPTDEAIFICELIQEQNDGYVSELAIDARARIEAAKRFQTLFQNIPNPAVALEYNGTEPIISNVNSEYENTFSFANTDISGKSFLETAYEETEETYKAVNSTLQNGEKAREEISIETPNGTRHFDLRATPHRTDKGQLQAFVIYSDITKAKEREKELQEREQALEESNKELEQFAYVASHDLQEPLRMITSYLDILKMEYQDELDEDADEYIHYAVDGAERMKRLIDDLLKYSRVNTDEKPHESTDFNNVLDNVLEALAVKIEDTNATVTNDDLPILEADASQINQLFQNIIANAINYAKEDTPPEIELRVKQDGDEYHFAIEDNGVGIPEEQQDRIFEVFNRGTRTDDSGSGIGLSICQRIVNNHGGEIWVESVEGEGTTFHFTMTNENSNPENNVD